MKTERRLGPGDDLEMINSPELWPCWPVLPMKNYTKDCPLTKSKPMTGIIVNGRGNVVVFVGTLGLTDWGKAEFMEYPTVEALLADGWVVD